MCLLSYSIPLFKKGDRPMLVNYRPVSILPTISKQFKRTIHVQIYEHLIMTICLLNNSMNFANFTQQNMLQMESGKTPCNLYIDLSKAFDTLYFVFRIKVCICIFIFYNCNTMDFSLK